MSDTLTLRQMTKKELRDIYNTWMVRQFHPGELKPLKMMESLMDRDAYSVYGLWDGVELISYALFAMAEDSRVLLLDYYAVLPDKQDRGYGGKCLTMLKEELDAWEGIVIEVENPALQDDAAEREVCLRRMRFYECNDCEHTRVLEKLFGFEYEILFLSAGGRLSDDEIFHEMENIYHNMLPADIYEKNVFLRKAD